jgi:hypothetical protein
MTADVYVEQCEVELGGLCQELRLVDPARLDDNAMSELLKHIGNHHPNERFASTKKIEACSGSHVSSCHHRPTDRDGCAGQFRGTSRRRPEQ